MGDNSPLFLRDKHLQSFLHNEKGGVSLQLPSWVNELKVVVPQKSGDDLVDLEQGKVPADTDMAAATELHDSCQLHSRLNLGTPSKTLLTWNMYLSILFASSGSPSQRSGR